MSSSGGRCVNCIRTNIDITEGLQKHLTILYCPECSRYLNPPRAWVKADPESKELLAFCIKVRPGNAPGAPGRRTTPGAPGRCTAPPGRCHVPGAPGPCPASGAPRMWCMGDGLFIIRSQFGFRCGVLLDPTVWQRIKNLSKVRLVDASFIWTEPHSKRLKVKVCRPSHHFAVSVITV